MSTKDTLHAYRVAAKATDFSTTVGVKKNPRGARSTIVARDKIVPPHPENWAAAGPVSGPGLWPGPVSGPGHGRAAGRPKATGPGRRPAQSHGRASGGCDTNEWTGVRELRRNYSRDGLSLRFRYIWLQVGIIILYMVASRDMCTRLTATN